MHGCLEAWIKDGGIGVVHRRQPPDFAVAADIEEFVQGVFLHGTKFNPAALEDQGMLKPLGNHGAPVAVEFARRSTRGDVLHTWGLAFRSHVWGDRKKRGRAGSGKVDNGSSV